MKKQIGKEKIFFVVLNIALVLALAVVIAPLLILSHYNYPTADDWAFGRVCHDIMASGGTFFDALSGVINMTISSISSWEPRFMGPFMAGVNPSVWGDVHYYRVVTWIILIALTIAMLFFFKILLLDSKKKNAYFILPVVMPFLIIQILCCPYPEEAFYWYCGSMVYCFLFSLSLIQLGIIGLLLKEELSVAKIVFFNVVACLLSFVVGGGNYATSLSQWCIFTLVIINLLIGKKKYLFKRIIAPFFVLTIALAFCVLAPGNASRLNGNFGGTTNGIFWTIGMSLWRTLTNIYSWTLPVKMWLLILIVVPFLWLAVKNLDYEFKLPGLFTFLSYGVYATQITATMYVDGNTGGCRMADILYFAYLVWLLLNLFYWIGWIERKLGNNGIGDKISKAVEKPVFLCTWIGVMGVLLAGSLYTTELNDLTSYKAYAAIRSGAAERYAAQWEERLEILNNPEIEECYFDPIPREYGNMCYYCDFEEGSWVNSSCASYYHKKSVNIRDVAEGIR